MSMIEQYESMILKGDIYDDPLQRNLIDEFQKIIDGLARKQRSWFRRSRVNELGGLYLSGPVGGGKTFLMDLFFKAVPLQEKMRMHLHQFMQLVDTQLRFIQGHVDPLRKIAADIARKNRLLCFDEFIVSDIATAMILAELLQYLFEYGVVFVATSNTPPDELYLNGLQRTRFLPAIALINNTCQVLSLPEKRDYRMNREKLYEAYIYPHDELAIKRIDELFSREEDNDTSSNDLLIQGRLISCIKHGKKAVWFDFNVICNLPRSQLDYLEIAKNYETVFVTDVPMLGEGDTIRTLLLTHLVDVMYDQGVRLVISSAVPVDMLYQNGEMQVPFRRTRSRLQEMQSVDYFERWQNRGYKK